jgi:hypothetical protein
MMLQYDSEGPEVEYEILYINSNKPENRFLDVEYYPPNIKAVEQIAKRLEMDAVEISTVTRSVVRYQVDLT